MASYATDHIYVYVVHHARSGLSKIGKTVFAPKERFSAIANMNPVPDELRLAWWVKSRGPARHYLESDVHHELRIFREHGEWFSATPDFIARTVESVARANGLKLEGSPW